MSNTKARIEELLPFYTLDVLTDAEKEEVEAYLVVNPDAQAELAEIDEVLLVLASSVPPAVPSDAVKSSLMQRVKTDLRARSQPVVTPAASTRPLSRLTEFLRRLRSQSSGWLMPVLATVSLMIALGVGVWAYNLQNQVQHLRSTLATINQSLDQKLTLFEAKDATLRQELSAQTETVATLRSQLTGLRTENLELQQQIVNQRQTLAQITTRMAGLSVDGPSPVGLNRVQSDLADQQVTLAALDETVTVLTDRIDQLQSTNASLQRELSAQRAAMAQLTTPNLQVMLINGTEILPNAHGHFVANPEDDSALLVVAGLPRLQPGQEYQFWLVQNGTPMRAGTLDISDDGLGLLLISSPEQIGSFEAMGISIEPAGSSGAPESQMIMLGRLAS